MYKTMIRQLSRYISEYLDSRIIFFVDFILSVIASGFILLIINFLTLSGRYAGTFAAYWMMLSMVCTTIALFSLKSYRVIVRHATLKDHVKYIFTVLIKVALMGAGIAILTWPHGATAKALLTCVFLDFLLTIFFILGVRIAMFVVYDYYKKRVKFVKNYQQLLIYGTSDKSVAVVTRFQTSKHFKMVGFLSDRISGRNLRLANLPVYSFSTNEELAELTQKLYVDGILFATDDDLHNERETLIHFCTQNGIKTYVVPGLDEVVDGKVMSGKIREVKIEDLLGRPEIKISLYDIRRSLANKTVLVTGAAGSIGSELCRQLAGFGVSRLVLFDNAETPMHNLRLELEARYPDLPFEPVIGDVRQHQRIDFAFRKWKPQVVFHAAAYKHVPLMEENPCEAVQVNVTGSRYVAEKCVEYGVEKMVMISTDKAVNPTNIMGCTKRLAEIYVQSLGLSIANGTCPIKTISGEKPSTQFVTTRFGNVLGSNGSVIPRFREQIEKGGPVTVTHPEITRFFMTIPEACRLVLEAATMNVSNKIFVFDMGSPVKINELAKRMIELAGFKVGKDIDIVYSGLRPGEKLYEEVLSNTENTDPTSHDKIRIAKVREYEYADVYKVAMKLHEMSMNVEIPEMVMLMKQTVPEYKSKNSVFEKYDEAVKEQES